MLKADTGPAERLSRQEMTVKLYTWNTPNGQKPVLLLEECEGNYQLEPVDITRGAQTADAFLAVNPNGKIPALVDGPVTVFESGAVLIYIAEKFGRFLPSSSEARAAVMSWSFWQVGGMGPMIGQWGHFLGAEGKHDYAVERFAAEAARLFAVIERRLAASEWLAGGDYTIADMMVFPWARGALYFLDASSVDRLGSVDATQTWIERIEDRPATVRASARLQAMCANR